MQKIILDDLNTFDSVEWQHKGFTVFLNSRPTTGDKYCICRSGAERAEFSAATLEDARQLIETELKTTD